MNKLLLIIISNLFLELSNHTQASIIHNNKVTIEAYVQNDSIGNIGDITDKKATVGQPFDDITTELYGDKTVIQVYAGRHGSNDPVQELSNQGFNTNQFWSNRVNFMFTFSLKVGYKMTPYTHKPTTYTCPDLALAQESDGYSFYDLWSLFAKNVDSNGKPNSSIGDYINVDSKHNLNIYCYNDDHQFNNESGIIIEVKASDQNIFSFVNIKLMDPNLAENSN